MINNKAESFFNSILESLKFFRDELSYAAEKRLPTVRSSSLSTGRTYYSEVLKDKFQPAVLAIQNRVFAGTKSSNYYLLLQFLF